MDAQISPRPCVAMKLMTSGVALRAAVTKSPSFSRSSSSTTIITFPFLISEIASSMVLRDVFIGKTNVRKIEDCSLPFRGLPHAAFHPENKFEKPDKKRKIGCKKMGYKTSKKKIYTDCFEKNVENEKNNHEM